MAGLMQRLALSVALRLGAQPERRYAAANVTRFTSDWTTVNQTANAELRYKLRILRARARQLERDDDYMRRFLSLLEVNVVGHTGIQLQANARTASGDYDEQTNKKVEAAWAEFCKKKNFSATGKESYIAMLRLAIRTVARDGEFIARKIYSRKNPFGFSLHVIDADWLDEDYNDVVRNSDGSEGNRIIMSVEVDRYNKPVAYWFTPPRYNTITIENVPPQAPVSGVRNSAERVRVPANEIIHLFIKERAGQVRGVTWAHTAMRRMNMLDGYEEAELVGARVAASKMGFIIPPQESAGLADDDSGVLMNEVSPGTLAELPAGYDFKAFDPHRPTSAFTDFTKTILRAISSGLGVNYVTLANDLEGVNFSSIRQGEIADRDAYKIIQTWLKEDFCQEVYDEFLALNLGTPSLPIPVSKLDRLRNPLWLARGWDWVDPFKDVKADIAALQAGITTRARIIAERGGDFEETMEQLAREQQTIKRLGLDFVLDISNQGDGEPMQSVDSGAGGGGDKNSQVEGT